MASSAPHRKPRSAVRSPRVLTICVVDPQAPDHQHWVDDTQAEDVRVQCVASAEAALRFSRTSTVDLWVVNAELPGLSGCELCAIFKDRSPAVPVYLVTDRYSAAVEQAARQARATLFSCKPLHAAWIQSWLAQRREKQQARRAQGLRTAHAAPCKPLS